MKINLSNLILSLMLFCVSSSFAQTSNTDELKREITNLQHQLSVEKEKVSYFKEALDLRNRGLELTIDSVSIQLTEVVGDSNEKKIIVSGLIINHSLNKRNFQFHNELQFIDPKGNAYDYKYLVAPNGKKLSLVRIENIENGIPYRFQIVFENILDKTPVMSLLRIKSFNNPLQKNAIYNFKALDITWQ